MVDLTLQPASGLTVRAIEADGFRIGEDSYAGAIIITPDEVEAGWPPQRPDDLTTDHLESLLARSPEVVIIGTGPNQQFLEAEHLLLFQKQGIGVEVMTTRSACHTYNVLVSENRFAVAGLMPLTTTQSAG